MKKLIILGSGCAGLTAALYAARANLNPIIIEGNTPGGQITTTSKVENFPGFPEGILGYDLIKKIREQCYKFGVEFIKDNIIDFKNNIDKKILISNKNTYESKSIIISTGASPKFLNIPGEKEFYGGKGVTTCATCDGPFYKDMDVVVIGGGDSACEEAIHLTNFCSNVYLIHRRNKLRASQIMQDRVLKNKKIKIIWNTIVSKIIGEEEYGVQSLEAKNIINNEIINIKCSGVFLSIGHTPNTKIFEKYISLDKNGYIITKSLNSVFTNIKGIFAAGDCVDKVYRQAITAAASGCQAAIESEKWLLSNDFIS